MRGKKERIKITLKSRGKCYSSSLTLFRLTNFADTKLTFFFFPLNALSNHLEQRVLQLFIKQYTRADVYKLSHDSASLSLITLHNFILRFPVA